MFSQNNSVIVYSTSECCLQAGASGVTRLLAGARVFSPNNVTTSSRPAVKRATIGDQLSQVSSLVYTRTDDSLCYAIQ